MSRKLKAAAVLLLFVLSMLACSTLNESERMATQERKSREWASCYYYNDCD